MGKVDAYGAAIPKAELLVCIEDAHRQESPLVIVMVDLDHFKRVNDRHGHAAGDTALAYLARALTSRLRPSDFVGRFGGDEFLLVMPNARASSAVHVLDTVRMEVRCRPDLPFTISCGGTVLEKGDTAKTMLKRADDNLYRVKHVGREGVLLRASTEGISSLV
jgi:diguanylate cyclase